MSEGISTIVMGVSTWTRFARNTEDDREVYRTGIFKVT